MGNGTCSRFSGKDDSRFYRNIYWDSPARRNLTLVPGESEQRRWNHIEDCVNGVMGTLQITTLRFIWFSDEVKSERHGTPRSSISIGLQCIDCVHFNVTDSKFYGRTRCASITANMNKEVYEFGFAPPKDLCFTMFSILENWHKRFKSTRVFRESLIREYKMTRKGVFMPQYPETIIREYPDIENIAASKKYPGRVVITNHRFVWISSRTSIVNASLPFMQIRFVQLRSTTYGLGLVIAASNVSCSKKATHFPEATYGEIVLGFRSANITILRSIEEYIGRRVQELRAEPYYMPHEGRVCYSEGRWGVNVDDEGSTEEPDYQELNVERESVDVEIGDHVRSSASAFPTETERSCEPVPRSQSDEPLTAPPLDESKTPIVKEDAGISEFFRRKLSRAESPEPTSPASRRYKAKSRVDAYCVVCLSHHAEVAFDPCGHICCCHGCGTPLKECPMCRKEIIKSLRVFMIT